MAETFETIQRKRQERLALWTQLGELREARERQGGKLTAEQLEKFRKIDGDLERLGAELEAAETAREEELASREVELAGRELEVSYARLERELSASAGTVAEGEEGLFDGGGAADPGGAERAAAEYGEAFFECMRFGYKLLNARQRSAFERFSGLHLKNEELAARLKKTNPELLALITAGDDASMGYLWPPAAQGPLTRVMKSYGGFFEAPIDYLETVHNRPIPFPVVDDTANKGAYIGEGQNHGGGKAPKSKSVPVGVHDCSSLIVRLHLRFLGGLSNTGVQDELMAMFGERIGRRANEAATRGSGDGEPRGILHKSKGAKQGHAAGQALEAVDFVRLEHRVDRNYRRDKSAGFMLSDSALEEAKLMTIGSGDKRPLWVPSRRESEPDKIAGYPYWVNDDLDPVGPNSVPIVFGAWRRYKWRVYANRFVVVMRERFIDDGEVGYLMIEEHDGALLDQNALKYLKMPADALSLAQQLEK